DQAGRPDAFLGLPMVRFEELEARFAPADHEMFVAIGYGDLNKGRRKVYASAKAKGYRLLSFRHPSAVVAANCVVGDNCFIVERTALQPFVTVGANVFLWSGNIVSHESV